LITYNKHHLIFPRLGLYSWKVDL